MPTINPYINFNGNAEEAFAFYRSVFGGEFRRVVRFGEVTIAGCPTPASDADKILLIELAIGPTVLRANDVPQSLGRVSENEHRSKIAVVTDSREEAERIFAGLSSGGAVEMPLGESPWGTYFAAFRDRKLPRQGYKSYLDSQAA